MSRIKEAFEAACALVFEELNELPIGDKIQSIIIFHRVKKDKKECFGLEPCGNEIVKAIYNFKWVEKVEEIDHCKSVFERWKHFKCDGCFYFEGQSPAQMFAFNEF